jgi:hypothetical protein
MNSELVHLMADRWAQTLIPEGSAFVEPSKETDQAKIETLWLSAFSRWPRPDEVRMALEFLDSERSAFSKPSPRDRERAAYAALNHALFASKEFVFLR